MRGDHSDSAAPWALWGSVLLSGLNEGKNAFRVLEREHVHTGAQPSCWAFNQIPDSTISLFHSVSQHLVTLRKSRVKSLYWGQVKIRVEAYRTHSVNRLTSHDPTCEPFTEFTIQRVIARNYRGVTLALHSYINCLGVTSLGPQFPIYIMGMDTSILKFWKG